MQSEDWTSLRQLSAWPTAQNDGLSGSGRTLLPNTVCNLVPEADVAGRRVATLDA